MKRTEVLLQTLMVALPLSCWPLDTWSTSAEAADLVDTARQSSDFNTLIDALDAAGLTEKLRAEGPFTLFAPSDQAFRALPEGMLEDLMRPENRERLVRTLSAHVVAGKAVGSKEIPMALETMGGDTIAVTSSDAGVSLRLEGDDRALAAGILAGDIAADNGVIHLINTVLMPSDNMAAAQMASDHMGAGHMAAGHMAAQAGADAKNAAAPSALLPAPEPDEAEAIPFEGSLPPDDPPPPAAPPPREITDADKAALGVLYERPSPAGPEPVAREPAAALSAMAKTGDGDIFRILPGEAAFPDKIPSELLIANGDATAFSQNIVRLPSGEVRVLGVDRTMNDTKLSKDELAFEASFTDEKGNDWRVQVLSIAPIGPDPIVDPWYGGAIIDVQHHGQLFRGTPQHPLIQCDLCGWGWGDVWMNGAKVGSSALVHTMVASRAHRNEADLQYSCYDCTDGPVDEIHMVVTEANLPTPGGFLHVMWHGAKVKRGTPEEITAEPIVQQPDYPTLTLDAVPHLQWSETEIKVDVGQTVRLVLNNMDPSSFHGFVLRGPTGIVQVPLEQGSQWVTSVVFDQPGEYEFWCPVANHRNRGMYGRIVVAEGVPGGTEGPPGEDQPAPDKQ